jgi:hypothetical protein
VSESRKTKTEQFLAFHKANPDFYKTLVRFAREVKAHGREKYGMSNVMGRARWAFDVETVSPDDEDAFELNDHVGPYYARALMTFEPDLDGLFNVRSTKESEPDAWIKPIVESRAARGIPYPTWYLAHFAETEDVA